MKVEGKIRNWSIINSGNPYRAPEAETGHLKGDVENHPALGTHKGVVSSPIQTLDLKGRRAETNNTIYLLEGPPDSEWVKYLADLDYDLTKLPE